nr:hypothetical protein L203_04057 [Cryptococcus depauperatus CBS 7841]
MPVTVTDQTRNHQRIKHQYTMRKSPYLVSLLFLLTATALTLLNIYAPQLIHVKGHSPGPTQFESRYGLYRRCTRSLAMSNNTLSPFLQSSHPLPDPKMELLLTDFHEDLAAEGIEGPVGNPVEDDGHQWVCQSFPTRHDIRSECQQFGEKFCVLWSTAGYSAQLSLVPCLASLISLLFIFLHRGERTARAKARRQQWKLVSGNMFIHCILQILSIAMILHVFRTDARFETKGSHLDDAFSFGVASAIVSLTHVLLLAFTAMSAKAGKTWAAGKSAKKSRRHRRTRSGRVVLVPEGTPISGEEIVTTGELRTVDKVNERTGLLGGHEGSVAGGGGSRATDNAV